MNVETLIEGRSLFDNTPRLDPIRKIADNSGHANAQFEILTRMLELSAYVRMNSIRDPYKPRQ